MLWESANPNPSTPILVFGRNQQSLGSLTPFSCGLSHDFDFDFGWSSASIYILCLWPQRLNPSSMSNNRNKRRRHLTDFQWHTSGINQAPATVRVRHTDFSLDNEGPASLRTTLIPSAASPSRRRTDTEPVYQEDYLLTQLYNTQVENGLDDMEVDNGLGQGDRGVVEGRGVVEDEGVDPQYQRHLDDSEMGTGKTRRKRTAEV